MDDRIPLLQLRTHILDRVDQVFKERRCRSTVERCVVKRQAQGHPLAGL
jgi:hypothetical protein